MKNPTDLRELLLMKTQELYDIENQLVKALPRLIKKAANEKLKNAIDMHLKETEGHVERLEQIFEQMGEDPKKIKSETIRGLVEDADAVVKGVDTKTVRDAGIIAAASATEHFEMAGYTIARDWATLLGEKDQADLFDANLKEEIAANEKLSKIAAEEVNNEANAVDEAEDKEDEEEEEEEELDDDDDEEEDDESKE
jgi:ferritin-like metal-binding protein YciE